MPAVGSQHVGTSYCFLCGSRLRKSTRSDEHVFPKWLLHRFNLWNQQLKLLNRTAIPYRALKIPCCRRCNSHHWAPIEEHVKNATARGPSAVRRLSKRTLYLWLAKILYGILYKEGLLPLDRKNPGAGRLVGSSLLRAFQMHHWLLQGARIPMRFLGFFPGSIFVFRVQDHLDHRFKFDFRDLPDVLGIALRMGSVGVVAALQDGGSQAAGFGSHLDRYRQYPLHPIQFLELVAMVFYKATLLNRTPKYLITEGTTAIQVIQMPLQDISLKPLYDDWDQAAYARHLAFHLNLEIAQVYRPPNGVMHGLTTPMARLDGCYIG